jgi:hypothetical protein
MRCFDFESELTMNKKSSCELYLKFVKHRGDKNGKMDDLASYHAGLLRWVLWEHTLENSQQPYRTSVMERTSERSMEFEDAFHSISFYSAFPHVCRTLCEHGSNRLHGYYTACYLNHNTHFNIHSLVRHIASSNEVSS